MSWVTTIRASCTVKYKRSVLTDNLGGGACEESALGGTASLTAPGVKLAKNSSSQLKNIRLSSGERLDQSISVSSSSVSDAARLGITEREGKSGRVDRTLGGAGPFVIGGGFGWEDEGISGGADTATFPRGGGGGGPEAVPREGRGGAGDAPLLLESDREAGADVRVGGGGSRGFVFWLTRLLGGDGGGGGSPLYGSQFVLAIGTLKNCIAQ